MTRICNCPPHLLALVLLAVTLTACSATAPSAVPDASSPVPAAAEASPSAPPAPAPATIAPVAPATNAPAAPASGDAAGSYAAALPAADAEARLLTLTLAADGSARLITGYVGKGTVVESGSWQQDGARVAVTLDVRDDTALEDPVLLAFEMTDGNLVNTEWEETDYGADGMGTLLRQP